MAEPRQAFADNPRVACTIALTHRAAGRVWGGEPEWEEGDPPVEIDPEKAFARGHTEQHMAVTGVVTVGDERFELHDGLGMRDHSWGPRYWQSIWWYRWLTGNLGPGLGFACTVSGGQDGGVHTHGFLYDTARYGDDRWVPIRDVQLTSEYDDDWYHHALHATVTTTTTRTRSTARCGRTSPCATGARHPTASGDHAHRRGHDDVALRGPRRLGSRRVPRPGRRRHPRRDHDRLLTDVSDERTETAHRSSHRRLSPPTRRRSPCR